MTQSILQQWRQLLHDDGVAVQFTYNLRRPKWRRYVQAQQTSSKIVWANFPPANITTFSFKTAKLPAFHEHEPTKPHCLNTEARSEEHTYEIQSLMRISLAVISMQQKTS